jgi:single-stranded-DNA-specific exonuclease
MPGTSHAGFVFGPRVNAGGRVGKSDLGVRLLSTNDTGIATDIAQQLNELNRERQDLESRILTEAIDQVEGSDHTSSAIIIAAGEGWHPGVIGIVASRLKDRYNRPACVIALNDGTGTGSGRSITGVDLGEAIIAARQSGHLTKGGGHEMAAGFSLDQANLQAFTHFMEDRIKREIEEKNIEPIMTVDGAVTTGGANLDLLAALEQISPFGAGNAEPRFVIANARLGFVKVVGTDHVKCSIEDGGGSRLDGIAFRCVETGLGQTLLHHNDTPLHIAGKLRSNTWQGRTSVQMIIDDVAKVW